MRSLNFSIVNGCSLLVALVGAVGCATDAGDATEPTQTVSDAVDETAPEPFDPARAAEIAKAKMASIGAAAIEPRNAACGTNGPTGTSRRVNDAAFTGAARQRTGSSTGCTARGELQPTDDALYFCWTAGNDGFTWTYNQNIRTGVRGWTRDDLLRGNGASNNCGF